MGISVYRAAVGQDGASRLLPLRRRNGAIGTTSPEQADPTPQMPQPRVGRSTDGPGSVMYRGRFSQIRNLLRQSVCHTATRRHDHAQELRCDQETSATRTNLSAELKLGRLLQCPTSVLISSSAKYSKNR